MKEVKNNMTEPTAIECFRGLARLGKLSKEGYEELRRLETESHYISSNEIEDIYELPCCKRYIRVPRRSEAPTWRICECEIAQAARDAEHDEEVSQ